MTKKIITNHHIPQDFADPLIAHPIIDAAKVWVIKTLESDDYSTKFISRVFKSADLKILISNSDWKKKKKPTRQRLIKYVHKWFVAFVKDSHLMDIAISFSEWNDVVKQLSPFSSDVIHFFQICYLHDLIYKYTKKKPDKLVKLHDHWADDVGSRRFPSRFIAAKANSIWRPKSLYDRNTLSLVFPLNVMEAVSKEFITFGMISNVRTGVSLATFFKTDTHIPHKHVLKSRLFDSKHFKNYNYTYQLWNISFILRNEPTMMMHLLPKLLHIGIMKKYKNGDWLMRRLLSLRTTAMVSELYRMNNGVYNFQKLADHISLYAEKHNTVYQNNLNNESTVTQITQTMWVKGVTTMVRCLQFAERYIVQ